VETESSISSTPRAMPRSPSNSATRAPKARPNSAGNHDAPLATGNWEIVAPSPLPWSASNQIPREMTRADMDKVRDDFVRAAEMAARIGFDWLELHYAHGYLMSSFITPLTNKRTDEYGGSPENRMRFPARSYRAVRAIWPDDKPISVRISANDWWGPTASRRRMRSSFPACWSRPGRSYRRLRRPDLDAVKAGLWPHVPDAALRPHPQRGRRCNAGGRQHLRARPRQLDPDGRSVPIWSAWRARIWPTPIGRLPRGADARFTDVTWPKPYWPAAINSTASNRATKR